jgi:hypothetical protein
VPEAPELLSLPPAGELPVCVQWCVLADGAPLDPELLGPELADADGDAAELGDDDADVVRVDVVSAELAPPLDASATPVAPAPSPAAIAPVMISRRTRLPAVETIGASSLPGRPRVVAGLSSAGSLRGQPATALSPRYQRNLNRSDEPSGCQPAVKSAYSVSGTFQTARSQPMLSGSDSLAGVLRSCCVG